MGPEGWEEEKKEGEENKKTREVKTEGRLNQIQFLIHM